MSSKREEKALREFKQIMDDLLILLAGSTGATTATLYWVNRSREQFVLETSWTSSPYAIFKDRVNFEEFYLNRYKDIESVTRLRVGDAVSADELTHYFQNIPIDSLLLIPFRNKGETVAITVIEGGRDFAVSADKAILSSYRSAHLKVLNTYLELTDLYEEQNRWVRYEKSLEKFEVNLTPPEILKILTEELQALLPDGGSAVAVRGMESWVTVLRSASHERCDMIPLGLMVEEKSMAFEALQKGENLFSMHFNNNPKRISTSELRSEGATLAVPMLINGRRQAIVLAYDKNPLVFTEAVKHKISNLVRVAGFRIRAAVRESETSSDLFATEYGSIDPELWQITLEKLVSEKTYPAEHVWFGLVGIENLSELRASFRLGELKKIQRIIVKALNPSRLGYNGFIGFHSDYVYPYLFVSDSEDHHNTWLKRNMNDLAAKVDMGDGRRVAIQIKAGSVKTDPGLWDPDEILNDAKQALNVALKSTGSSASYSR